VVPTLCATLIGLTLAANPAPAYIVRVTAERPIEAELTFLCRYGPNFKAKEWMIFAAQPPELPGQAKVRTMLEPNGKGSAEAGALGRPVLLARLIPANGMFEQQFTVKVKYQATLRGRQLVERGAGDKATAPVLSETDRQTALAATGLCDFTSAEFQKWLDARKLRRGNDEDDVAFARRAYLAITGGYRYDYQPEQDRHVSKLATAKATDCGGMTLLFVGALRASKMPARVLAGRWAESAKPGAQLGGVPFLQYHVKAEFYARDVGWVPADPASGVLHDKKDGLVFFGNDPGNFFTMHVDTDLVLDTMFGKKTVPFMQGINFWVRGNPPGEKGTSEEAWVVKK